MDEVVGAEEREDSDQRISHEREPDFLFLGKTNELLGGEMSGGPPGERRRAGTHIESSGVSDLRRAARLADCQRERAAMGHAITSASSSLRHPSPHGEPLRSASDGRGWCVRYLRTMRRTRLRALLPRSYCPLPQP